MPTPADLPNTLTITVDLDWCYVEDQLEEIMIRQIARDAVRLAVRGADEWNPDGVGPLGGPIEHPDRPPIPMFIKVGTWELDLK